MMEQNTPLDTAANNSPGLTGNKNLRPKKAASKLKRSSQMGNLYRRLKGKLEGSCLTGKSQGKRKIGAPAGGKQGMAYALAEMTTFYKDCLLLTF
ncbi:hypothetical protein LIER_24220 [Lithospermum erythrorhizon]|uniref:Uncharacterized protein n=1 Tax=Lithospermum erythrorhizon TaxID=34254 RepID=A0AAV3R3J0_LITER